MSKSIFKILDAIPIETIYKYLEQRNASEKQIGGNRVGSKAASRKAKKDAMETMIRKIVL